MSKKNRRTFSTEFKQEAANLVIEQGYSIAAASQAVGVSDSVLRRWVKQLRGEKAGITPQGKAMTPEHHRIQELEKRIKQLEQEKSILKKATALLMSDGARCLR